MIFDLLIGINKVISQIILSCKTHVVQGRYHVFYMWILSYLDCAHLLNKMRDYNSFKSLLKIENHHSIQGFP